MFDLEKFKTGEYYVHLPTKELYDDVMEFLDKNGFVWGGSRDSLDSEHYWSKYKADTAISGEINNGIKYGSEQNYISEGYKKLDFKKGDIDMNEKMKRDLVKLLFEKEFSEYEIEGMYFITISFFPCFSMYPLKLSISSSL